MKIGKPLLLVITPLGVAGGLYEAYRLAGGLVLLMAALVGMLCAAFAQVVYTIRQERRAARDPAGVPGALACGIEPPYGNRLKICIPRYSHWRRSPCLSSDKYGLIGDITQKQYQAVGRHGSQFPSQVIEGPIGGKRKPASVGLPVPLVEMMIMDEAGREVPHGPRLPEKRRDPLPEEWRRADPEPGRG